MKKITLILVIIATFATKSFAYCPIPQWCPSAPLHQTLCPGDTIETIEFPSVIAKTLIITWWMNETRTNFRPTPPPGITVSGDASTPLGDREYAWPVSIKGTPTAIGTHHYTVSNTCGVELLHGSITINTTPPTIGMVTPTIDQATPQNIVFDSTLTLTAEPAGSMPPITIQWYSNTTASSAAGTGGTAVSGATGNIFAPPATTPNAPNGIFYYAVVTDRCGRTATITNTSGKHIVVPASTGTSGDLSLCTGTNYIPDIGAVSWGGSTNIEANARTISGNGITQVWSDHVTTATCNIRTTFTFNNTVTDCRNAINGFNGDYFNFCFVIRYQDQLCPGDWRVPTGQDFINLDVALGGNGTNRSVGSGENGFTGTGSDQKYTGTGAGNWGGSRFTATASTLSDANSRYWSSSEYSAASAFRLGYSASGVYPQDIPNKSSGFALRCVR